MSFQIEFAFSPAHELLASFFAFTCKSTFRKTNLDKNWKSNLKKTLRPEFLEELDQYEILSKVSKLGFIHLLVRACPQQNTAQEFIDWLQALQAGEIYEILAPYMNQFPEDLGILRDKLVYFLTEWNSVYFQHVEANMLVSLQKECESRRDELGTITTTDIPDFIEKVTNGLYFEPVDGVVNMLMIPQSHVSPNNWVFPVGPVIICHYPVDVEAGREQEEPPRNMLAMARGLADGNRLKILRFLRKEPRSYTEVVQHIGLAKSTAHEHMLILRSVGLIRAHMVGDASVAYSLRIKGFELLREEIARWLDLEFS